MKVIIIEDEAAAGRRLEKLILEMEPSVKILALLDSVESAIKWHAVNEVPDLYFMDIQLADGLSFEIVTQLEIKKPIIFTTAFDEYALKAFKLNSIDYLLKPIDREELRAAVEKFKNNNQVPEQDIRLVLSDLLAQKSQFRERFLVKKGDSYLPLAIGDIAYFYAEEKVVFAKTKNNLRYLIDFTLDHLEGVVNPEQFFRANRQCLVSIEAVARATNSFNGKLKVHVEPAFEDEIIVSREKAQAFKNWLGKL